MHNQNNTNLKKHGGLYKYLKPPLDIIQKIVWLEILILSRTSGKIKGIRATDLVFVLIKAFTSHLRKKSHNKIPLYEQIC